MSAAYSLFDTLLEPIFVLNAEQKVVYCNETAAVVADLTVRKITRGLLFEDVLHFSSPLPELKNIATLTEPTPYRELNFTTASGQQGKVQITLQPIQNSDGEKNWIVFVRDVTLEERLQKKYRAELEQKEDVIKDLETAKTQLEDYSKNLEHKVTERTIELSKLNQMMSALLDSLGQGFFIFNAEGLCLEINSKACQETVECLPAGRNVWDVLRLPEKKVDGFKKWMMTVFSEMLPFEDLGPLGPNVFPHTAGKNISLEYFPLRSSTGLMEGVVVVASDITSLVEAKKQAVLDREHAKLIINLVQSKREVARFIRDTESLLMDLRNELSRSPLALVPANDATVAPTALDYDAIYRYLHTLKGGAASFSVQKMAEICHEAETQVNLIKEDSHPEHFQKLKDLCLAIEDSFSQFLTDARDILGAANISADRQIEIPFSKLQNIVEKIQTLPGGEICSPLLISELMMEPAGSFFVPYQDLAQRVAEAENKVIYPVVIDRGEIPVFPEVYSHLFATFVHAFRNAIDHGIEFPSRREELGKSPQGRIEVFFELQKADSRLQIRVTDDGQGVDPEKIRAKFAQKGVSLATETDHEVIQHIFDSQFSTREMVTETSGRGVGMDAIKMAALALGGQVHVSSVVGQGTELVVTVPYLREFTQGRKAA